MIATQAIFDAIDKEGVGKLYIGDYCINVHVDRGMLVRGSNGLGQIKLDVSSVGEPVELYKRSTDRVSVSINNDHSYLARMVDDSSDNEPKHPWWQSVVVLFGLVFSIGLGVVLWVA